MSFFHTHKIDLTAPVPSDCQSCISRQSLGYLSFPPPCIIIHIGARYITISFHIRIHTPDTEIHFRTARSHTYRTAGAQLLSSSCLIRHAQTASWRDETWTASSGFYPDFCSGLSDVIQAPFFPPPPHRRSGWCEYIPPECSARALSVYCHFVLGLYILEFSRAHIHGPRLIS